MTHFAPLLAGLIAGMIVGSFVLHWLLGLAQVIGSHSGKPNGQVVREAFIVTVGNSGFWILVVARYTAYQIFSGPLDKARILGCVGFVSAIALLGLLRGSRGNLAFAVRDVRNGNVGDTSRSDAFQRIS